MCGMWQIKKRGRKHSGRNQRSKLVGKGIGVALEEGMESNLCLRKRLAPLAYDTYRLSDRCPGGLPFKLYKTEMLVFF